jgi:SAM-dependent methyltransferase
MEVSSVEADFDRLAQLDDEGWTANNQYHDFLLKHVPHNCENALEIGCGTGAFARLLAARCKHVIALDLSSEMIRVARSRSTRVENLEFELADAMKWNFPQSHFDFSFLCVLCVSQRSLRQKQLKHRGRRERREPQRRFSNSDTTKFFDPAVISAKVQQLLHIGGES